MNIFITWVSRWIGKYLAMRLCVHGTLYGMSRTPCTLPHVSHFSWDICDLNFLQKIFCEIPPMDYLILNAGIGAFWKFHEIDISLHKHVIMTNFIGAVQITHVFFPKITKGIIAIGSIASKRSWKYAASYQWSKFGLRGWMMALKNEYPHLSIHIVNPFFVKETQFHDTLPFPVFPKKYTSLQAIGDVVENILLGKEKRFEIDV